VRSANTSNAPPTKGRPSEHSLRPQGRDHEPGTLGSFGAWRDPKELESLADHAYRYYGRETPLDPLEQRDGVFINRKDGTLLVKAGGDPLALIDPGSANVETWVRDDAGVITFLRLPNKREPKTVTEIDLQHAAAQRAVADTEKARLKFLRGQTLQPALRRTDGPNITLRAAIATVEHFEGRIELGPYGEVQVLFPPNAYRPHPNTP
jgi:hypothetical protein